MSIPRIPRSGPGFLEQGSMPPTITPDPRYDPMPVTPPGIEGDIFARGPGQPMIAQPTQPTTQPTAPDHDKIKDSLDACFNHVQRELWSRYGTTRFANLLRLRRLNNQWEGDVDTIPEMGQNGIVYRSLTMQRDKLKDGVIYRFNTFAGGGKKLIGVLGLPPNTTVKAISEGDEDFNSRASALVPCTRFLSDAWETQELVANIVHRFYTAGNAYLNVRLETRREWDETKPVARTEQVPSTEVGQYTCTNPNCPATGIQQSGPLPGLMAAPLCQTCGRPVDVQPLLETREVPAGEVKVRKFVPRIDLLDGFQVFGDPENPDWHSFGWLCREDEAHWSVFADEYPDLQLENEEYRRKYQSGSGRELYDNLGRMLRSLASKYNSNDSPDIWRRSQWWFRPSYYPALAAHFTGSGPNDAQERTRFLDALYQQAPAGIKAIFFNGVLCKWVKENLFAVNTGARSGPGRRFLVQPLGAEHAQSNHLVTDMFNIAYQTAATAIPLTLVDQDLLSARAVNSKPAVPASIWPIETKGQPLRDRFATIDRGELHPAVPQVMDQAIKMAQDNDSITPPLWGAGPVQETFGATELVRSAAIQPHNTTWDAVRGLLTGAMTNAIRLQLRNVLEEQERMQKEALALGADPIEFEQPVLHYLINGEPVALPLDGDPVDLLKGGWQVFCDPNLPLTPSQLRAAIWQVLQMGEPAFKIFDLIENPRNLEGMQQMLGTTMLEVKNLALYYKAMEIIKMLMTQAPVQGPDGQMRSSIPIDELDDHMVMAKAAVNWLNKNFAPLHRQREKAKGIENVRLWALDHVRAANPAPAPGAGDQGGGAPKPGQMPGEKELGDQTVPETGTMGPPPTDVGAAGIPPNLAGNTPNPGGPEMGR